MTQNRKNIIKQFLLSKGNKCFYCNRPMKTTGNDMHSATIEHIRPTSEGGTDDISNLALAHKACNHNQNWLHQTGQARSIILAGVN